jgi:hypothetical protein
MDSTGSTPQARPQTAAGPHSAPETTQHTTPQLTPHTTQVNPADQRDALLDAQRKANEQQPRNFKDDALDDKVVSVEPDGTGPTPTESFDPQEDRHGR